MRMMRCLLAIALVCGITGVAKADPVDFQMVVLDPAYSVNVINTTAFPFTFSPCVSPGQIPVGSSYDGCFTGQNETGQVLTSLQMLVPFIPSQIAGCASSGTGLDIFHVASCGFAPGGGFFLNFSDGSIPINGVFTIAESGVAAGSFPTVGATFNTTPEPNSILLLSTGVLMIGFFRFRQRRSAVLASRF